MNLQEQIHRIKKIMKISEGIYGDYLFGDNMTGVKLGLYDKEMEKDTEDEKKLFWDLDKYFNHDDRVNYMHGEENRLDKYVSIFKQLKNDYPEFTNSNMDNDEYLYRGTSFSLRDLLLLYKSKDKILVDRIEDNNAHDGYYTLDKDDRMTEQAFIIPNREYSSRSKINSWSKNFYQARIFAKKNETYLSNKICLSVVIRIKVKDADLVFNPEFINKFTAGFDEDGYYNTTGYQEDEILNIKRPVPCDFILLNEMSNR